VMEPGVGSEIVFHQEITIALPRCLLSLSCCFLVTARGAVTALLERIAARAPGQTIGHPTSMRMFAFLYPVFLTSRVMNFIIPKGGW
jgi:hypothetical protein